MASELIPNGPGDVKPLKLNVQSTPLPSGAELQTAIPFTGKSVDGKAAVY